MPAMRAKLIHAVALLLPLAVGTSAFAADPIEAKAKVCTTCHGENEVFQPKTTPVIWGQNAGYMFLQLRDFQSGARKNELMSPIAATLSRDDLLPLAEYFSKLKWPNLAQPEAPQDVAGKAQAAILQDDAAGMELPGRRGCARVRCESDEWIGVATRRQRAALDDGGLANRADPRAFAQSITFSTSPTPTRC